MTIQLTSLQICFVVGSHHSLGISSHHCLGTHLHLACLEPDWLRSFPRGSSIEWTILARGSRSCPIGSFSPGQVRLRTVLWGGRYPRGLSPHTFCFIQRHSSTIIVLHSVSITSEHSVSNTSLQEVSETFWVERFKIKTFKLIEQMRYLT